MENEEFLLNKIYKSAINSDCKVFIIYGGRDTGKSYFVGGQWIPTLMHSLPYFRGVCIRETYASLKDSCFLKFGMEFKLLSWKRILKLQNLLWKLIILMEIN